MATETDTKVTLLEKMAAIRIQKKFEKAVDGEEEFGKTVMSISMALAISTAVQIGLTKEQLLGIVGNAWDTMDANLQRAESEIKEH